MKKTIQNSSTQKRFQIMITVLSLLSLIPFGILLYHLYQLQLISTTEINNEGLIDVVLSRTISSPLILSGFIVGIVVWATNSIVSAIGIHRKIISPAFGYTTLILGGLGIHLFIILFSLLKHKMKIKSINRTKKAKTVATISVISIFGVTIGAFFGMGLSVNNYDAPFLGSPVQFSTDSSAPNVIEIFTDGFDQGNRDQYKADSDFKDFTWFNKYQTVGNETHRSVPSIWGDFKNNNLFQIRKDNNIEDPKESYSQVYGYDFLEAGLEHLNSLKPFFTQRSLINPICMSNDSGYSASTSGTPKVIAKRDPDLNITNWSGARDFNAGTFGVAPSSPDLNSYEYFADSSKVSKNVEVTLNGKKTSVANKGAYVLLCDLITHKPYMTSSNSDFTIFNTSAEDQKTVKRNEFKNIFSKLKEMKDDRGNAYDNSMIIIYGDHSNHYRKLRNEDGDITSYRHAESAMMIKYPNYSGTPSSQKTMKVIDNRVVYSASINEIINHFIDNKTNDSATQLKYLENDPLFDPNISRPTFYDNDHFMMTEWKKGNDGISRLVPSPSPTNPHDYGYTYKEWKALSSTPANDPLESVVY